MPAVPTPSGRPATRSRSTPPPTPLPTSPSTSLPVSVSVSVSVSAAFLPLTLSAIHATPAEPHRAELAPLADRAVAAERGASESWEALLGDCACAGRRGFPDRLRELSDAAGAYAGAAGACSDTYAAGDWWLGSRHRVRLIEFERWVAEALAEGDGEEFAEACAGYDAALARALVTVSGRPAIAAG